jgi:hypothetical protein
MHWEVLPHPAYSSDLSRSEFHLFDPLKEALEGKRFTADNEVKLFVQRRLERATTKFFERDIMMVLEDGDGV